MKHIIAGILLILATIWGGSYAMSLLSEGDWQRAPAYGTIALLVVVGFALVTWGATFGGKK